MIKTRMQPNVSEMFDQAVQTFDTALQTGVKLQEEALRWWTEILQESDSIQEFQRRAQSLMTDVIPTAQKSIDQYLSLLDRSYRTGMDLLRRAFEASQSESLAQAQNRMQELWQASFGAMRTNAQSLVQLNGRMMETWAEMAGRGIQEGASMARAGAGAADRAAEESARMASETATAGVRATRRTTAGARHAARASNRKRA